MTDPSLSPPSSRLVHLPRRASRRVLFVGVYAAVCLACLGLGWFAFVYLRWGVAPNQPIPVLVFAFPELKTSGVLEADRTRRGETFDVLMLGGSVLQKSWGDVEAVLRARLEARLGNRTRIYNLAESAHTSRDSLIKYRRVRDIPFDLVIVYDGINDVRMNVCPPGSFQLDYSHCLWYHWLDSRLAAGTIRVSEEMLGKLRNVDLIPRGEPDEHDLRFGADIRSPEALLANEIEILELAAGKGDPVLLLTNVICIPANYSRAAFQAKSLGFAEPGKDQMTGLAVELWGLPEVVRETIRLQNAALRRAAEGRGGVVLVDMEAGFESSPERFIDMCHLSAEGSRRFLEQLWPHVEPIVDAYLSERRENPIHAADR